MGTTDYSRTVVRGALGALVVVALLVSVADARILMRGGSRTPHAKSDAGTFTVRVVRLVAANRYDAAWTLLYPGHRGIVSETAYARCESLSPIPGRLQSIRVLSVKDERISVPGAGKAMSGASVRIRLAIVGLGRVVVTHTFHAVRVDGGWSWILPSSRYRLYLRGHCPDAPPDYRSVDPNGSSA